MDKKIKKQWVSALKSGEYKQGKNALCRGNQHGTFYCCLGVLSDLAVKAGACSREMAFKGNRDLNSVVIEWAGLNSKNPFFGSSSAIVLNDSGTSFDEIGSLIDKHL